MQTYTALTKLQTKCENTHLTHTSRNKNSQLYNHVHSEKAVPMLKDVSILYSNFCYELAINYSSDTAPTRQTGRPS